MFSVGIAVACLTLIPGRKTSEFDTILELKGNPKKTNCV